jgi:hypothetical protein
MEFLTYYLMAGVYIAAAVLGISVVVALLEKALGLNTAPRPHQLPVTRDGLEP